MSNHGDIAFAKTLRVTVVTSSGRGEADLALTTPILGHLPRLADRLSPDQFVDVFVERGL